ncbi:hypothetical protein DITRI_Ditri01bG0193700 [Diplodiscus trichospermus]
MELHLSYVTVFITFLFLFMVVKILKRSKVNNSTLNLPPGPRKLPTIGNIHKLISSMPHHTLRDLAMKYGPLMYLHLGEVPTIVVSSAKIAEEVLKTNDITFSDRPFRHAAEVSDFIKSIALNEGSPINLSEKIFSLLYGIKSRAAFGKKSKGQEEFIKIISETLKQASEFSLADMFPSIEVLKLITGLKIKGEKLHLASDRILEDIVNEYKERRIKMKEAGSEQAVETDLVDVLLKLQEQGDLEFPLTNDNIKAVIQD